MLSNFHVHLTKNALLIWPSREAHNQHHTARPDRASLFLLCALFGLARLGWVPGVSTCPRPMVIGCFVPLSCFSRITAATLSFSRWYSDPDICAQVSYGSWGSGATAYARFLLLVGCRLEILLAGLVALVAARHCESRWAPDSTEVEGEEWKGTDGRAGREIW